MHTSLGLLAGVLSTALSTVALAQAPVLPPQLAPITTSSLSAAVQTPTHWLSRDVPLLRWPDGQGTVAMLDAGQPVTIILTDKDQVRIRHGLDYGWVPLDAVTDQSPDATDATDAAKPSDTPQQ
ncbi:MAG: hypothetical protein GXP62_06210 [Oligoflexia bacterium]|nr:hypothetical protein [Oligoflexia bacterium]